VRAREGSDSKTRRGDGVAWWGIGVSALTLVLAMIRLGQPSLWSDEAYTSLLGAQILKFGLPRVSDGPLLIRWALGDAIHGIWIWDGWLQAYLSAAGEAIFGHTAWGGRFFHTLAGALIPWAAYPLFRAMSRRRGVAEAATLLTGLSVPFLLYIRQARYYPEGMLLTILLLRAYHAELHSRPRATPALALLAVLLFHTNVPWFGLLGLALGVHLILVRPPLPVVGRLLGAALATTVIVAPYALWARVWDRRITVFGTPIGPKDPYFMLAHLRHYFVELNLHAAPFLLLLLGGAAAPGPARKARAIGCLAAVLVFPLVLAGPHTAFELWVFTAALILFMALGLGVLIGEVKKPRAERGWMPGTLVALLFAAFLLGFAAKSTYPYLRYLCPLLPLTAFLTAASAFALFRRPWLAGPVLALVVVTNAVSAWPVLSVKGFSFSKLVLGGRKAEALPRIDLPAWLKVPSFEAALLYEGWKPEFPGPNLALRSPLAEYLGEITHSYRGPIDAIAEHLNAYKREGDRFFTVYGAYPIVFHTGLVPQPYDPAERPPRWIIPRAAYGMAKKQQQWLRQRRYREIVLDAGDTPYENRPEPDIHLFRTPRDVPPVRIGVAVE
jgi:hypothetical protein